MNRFKRMAYAGLAIIVLPGAGWLTYLKTHSGLGQNRPQVVVCIDPGHPSETNSGRTIQHGTTELEVNWAIALKLEELLSRDSRIRVVKTRDTIDEFTRNRDRAITANEADAAISVHLHCDAGPSRGFTTYYPDREGTCRKKSGPSDDVLAASKIAANVVHSRMAMDLTDDLRDRGIKGESHTLIGRRNGALTTSIWSEVPTITIEMVFLSSRSDAAFIKSEEGQWKMAAALADGIRAFIKPQCDALSQDPD